MSRPQLVCLLPVRNGEADLAGYFSSVGRFADTILAIDDGSTDGTRDLLESEPLVSVVLSNPRRSDYRGWDDASNRNRLLEAAEALDPRWILSLDADERIPADDADALRTFVERDAIAGCAYGFRVFRMWDDIEHYSRSGLWVYRMFAGAAGLRFPDRRLHFVPVPTTIPRSRWIRTTVRIQHLASLTAERRSLRFAKYREADPHNEFQHSYRDLLETAGTINRWETRPAGLSVIRTPTEPAPYEQDRPAISAIVISRDDESVIERSVASVVGQECRWPFEVIVVTSGSDRTAEIVRQCFPEVRLVELPEPALPGKARNAGLSYARGDYVSFPGSHVELPPGSLEARRRAHDLGYAMVTGTTLNGTTTRAGWASYFLDHNSVLPGRPSTELPGAPAHCSYSREALLEVGGFPEDLRAGEDTVVNKALADLGYVAFRAADVSLVHNTPCRTGRKLLRHHFVRGRGFGRVLLIRGLSRGAILRRGRSLFRSQIVWRLRTTHRRVRQWGGELNREYDRSIPWIILGAASAWVGTCYELWREASGPRSQPARPAAPVVRIAESAEVASLATVEPAALAPGNVPILLYHRLDVPGTRWSVTEEQLRWQLSWLRDHGYEAVTVSRILDYLGGVGSLPFRSVAITIDDGARDAPRFSEMLAEYGFAGTYFLPTLMALRPAQIRALATAGGEIGGHSTSHPDLSKLDRAAQLAEVADNKAFLEDVIGQAVGSFAYPEGMYDGRTVEILKEVGYGAAVDGDNGHGHEDEGVQDGRPLKLSADVDPFHLPRFAVVGYLTQEQFASVLQA